VALEQKTKKQELTGVQIIVRRNEVVLRLADNVVFASGTDEVQQGARSILSRMAADLKTRNVDIRVEGHTDDRPIRTARFHSNWDLSTSRATAVVLDFAASGIEPTRLSAAGYGEFHPIATNTTPEGRASNRRVDVVVSAKIQTEADEDKSSANDPEQSDAGIDAETASGKASGDGGSETAEKVDSEKADKEDREAKDDKAASAEKGDKSDKNEKLESHAVAEKQARNDAHTHAEARSESHTGTLSKGVNKP
ncbi:MAG: OmpA family protein, partial [Polyangiaceae bacterium]